MAHTRDDEDVGPKPVVRAFIAVELPAEMRRAVGQVIDKLSELPASRAAHVRWTRAENLHVTLKFLAHLEVARIPDLHGVIDQFAVASGGALRLGVEGAGCFPDSRRPKVICVGLRGDLARLSGLAGGLEQRLEGLGFPPEPRPFAPHLTVGRPGSGPGVGRRVEELISCVPHFADEFLAQEIVLYCSETLPEGARYTALHRVPLGHS